LINPKLVIGDCTPSYIYNPKVAKKINKHLPNYKIIILLRDPIERAYSHYKHMRRIGYESISTFEEAINREAERTSGELAKLIDQDSYYSHNRETFSYLDKGIYYPQVKKYIDIFGSKRVLVIDSADLFENTAIIMKDLENFLEIKHHDYQCFDTWNKGKKSSLNTLIKEMLEDFIASTINSFVSY
jgi:hypothetical protein